MSKTPDPRTQEIERLKAALEAITNQSTAVASVKKVGNKGRRYSASEKKTILADAAVGKTPEELLAKYSVSRETVTRWKQRAARCQAPAAVAPTAIKAEVLAVVASGEPAEAGDQHKGYHAHWRAVLKTWRSRPGLGPAQIKNQLYRDGIKISVATTRKIMEENGYTPPKTSIKEVELNRYEAVRAREIVHMDFKHFYINRQKVYLLLLQDDFSRFLCGFKMAESENMKAVIEVFEECVSRFGKMQVVMTDAGSAFYSWNGINKFQKLLSEEYGVDQIKAKTPRSNGKIENVNRQIEKEVLDVARYASLEEAHSAIREWVRFYNFERTHMGLPPGMVPADRFLYGWKSLSDQRSSLGGGPATELSQVETCVPAIAPPSPAPILTAAKAQPDPTQEVLVELLISALEKLKRAA